MNKTLKKLLCGALLGGSLAAQAIVVRDDVDDARYRVPPATFPPLVDLPGEGHGVLIAPQWVVTAAHAVTWQQKVLQVTLLGVERKVERIVVHPGYRPPPAELQQQALATWDWTLFRAALAASADIALVKLAEPVRDVVPAVLHGTDSEFGREVQIFGKGATGQGLGGYRFGDPRRTELRRAHNRVTTAHGPWFCYSFDAPTEALPLEGGSGSGDSGGPVLLLSDHGWQLAGLTAWIDPNSTQRTPGRYGQVTCNVRLNHYRAWIEGVTGERL